MPVVAYAMMLIYMPHLGRVVSPPISLGFIPSKMCLTECATNYELDPSHTDSSILKCQLSTTIAARTGAAKCGVVWPHCKTIVGERGDKKNAANHFPTKI